MEGQAVKEQAVKEQAVTEQAVKEQAVNEQAVEGQAVEGEAVKEQAVEDPPPLTGRRCQGQEKLIFFFKKYYQLFCNDWYQVTNKEVTQFLQCERTVNFKINL